MLIGVVLRVVRPASSFVDLGELKPIGELRETKPLQFPCPAKMPVSGG